MKVFLAGYGGKPWIKDNFYNFYRLESYLDASKSKETDYSKYKDFILDSGLFTYLNGKDSSRIDWEKYVVQYADFVKEYKIKNYVEVDADKIIGLENVERLRVLLEKRVGWKSIPVWHTNRGYDEWLKECKEYSYVCFGAFLTDGIAEKKYSLIEKFLQDAEKENCKVHGLGFTSMKYLKKLKFYSVDSSSWIAGNRYGTLFKFNGDSIISLTKPKNKRMIDPQKQGIHNFYEWVKFSQYADIKL